MKFKLDIENFGKIEQATIQINHLTGLAGQNNVGKRFINPFSYHFIINLPVVSRPCIQKTIVPQNN
jgi:predicted ATPase